MKPKTFFIFVIVLVFIAGAAIWAIISDYDARRDKLIHDAVEVTVYKNAGCVCCDRWITYMERNGYRVAVRETEDMTTVKDQNGIPGQMESCHTALIEGYVVEGHAPVKDINRLIRGRPDATGIAVPGMPASSPGMNTALNEPYDVYLIDGSGETRIFSSH